MNDGKTISFGMANIDKLERIVEDFEQYGIGLLASLVSWDLKDPDF